MNLKSQNDPIESRRPTDFFISYTGADRNWAEWIAWILEDAGYTVRLQAWDFRPGNNFVLMMQGAAAEARQTIFILSPDFLEASYAQPEWAAAFSGDPEGLRRKLIPIRVRECQPEGLIAQIVYIDLVVTSGEGEAAQCVLNGVKPGRAKPKDKPLFPGTSLTDKFK